MIARALLAIGVLFPAASVGAQSGDDYLRLLRVYRDQPALAAQTVAKLSPQAIDRGIQLCRAGHCSLQQIRAGAMLHADAAELVIGPNGVAARDQIRSGRELLQIGANTAVSINHATNRELQALASFGGRWYAMTARLLMAHGHLTVANELTVEGRVRYPESPDLFVVRGLLSEWRAGLGLEGGDLRSHIVRGELPERAALAAPYRGNVSFDLATASGEYRRAIAIDPAHAGARLRLAWVYLLTSDRRVWEDVPPEFIKSASIEYQLLAHLLRGTAAEHEKNASSALAEYQAARSVVPDSQTACLAASSAYALNGQLSEARGTAADCLKLGIGAPAVDAWTLFRLGLMDATTVDSLRDEARRP